MSLPSPKSVLITIALASAASAAASAVAAQERVAPIEIQHALFVKILALDRDLTARVGEELVIGVVYQPEIRASWAAKDDFMRAMAMSSVHRIRGIPVRGVPVEIGSLEDLARDVERHRIDVLYVGPMHALDVSRIAALARALDINTLTGIPAYVGSGLAVGICLQGKKPEILINLEAARAEGARFNAQLLRLARVVTS